MVEVSRSQARSNHSSDGGAVDRLVVGKNIGIRPASDAPCTLFCPRTVQTAAGGPTLSGDRAQRDQTAGVVSPGGVLGDAHPPVDDRPRPASAPGTGDLSDHHPGNTPDLPPGAPEGSALSGVRQRLVVAGALAR